MRVTYVLPQRNFFQCGIRGRVRHAGGFVSGLAQNSVSVELLSGPGSKKYISSSFFSDASPSTSVTVLWHLSFIYILLKKIMATDVMVIRWKPLWFLWGFPLLFFFREKVWFEMNALTGAGSRLCIVRKLSHFSVSIVSKFFNFITVTSDSLDQIDKISPHQKINVVIPNGFDDVVFRNFEPKVEDDNPLNIVYFGQKQPYYDWDIVYEVASQRFHSTGISTVNIFGFSEEGVEGVHFHGSFESQRLMLDQISRIPNVVLVLPASDTETARAGSPMKLYEYAALGVPVIVSSSLSDKVPMFKHFFVYRAGSKCSFDQALSEASVGYKKTLLKGSREKEKAFHGYSWKSVVKPWLQVVGF